MTINNISAQSSYASGLQQKQQTMNNLFSALKAGDLATAQKAYAAAGLPAMAKTNTSPLGRLFQALSKDDLAGAQKAALDMQPKGPAKSSQVSMPSNSKSVAAQHATAMAMASVKNQQNSVMAMLGIGNWHSPNSVDKYYCQNLNGRNANAKSQIHS